MADLNDVGESSPMPYYIQNLAEAEYVVATFMYLASKDPNRLPPTEALP